MSLKRQCLLCARPVPIQRRMSLFCSDHCEHRYERIKAAPRPPSRRNEAGSAPDTPPPPRRAQPDSAHRS